jgi:hypothetical protein
LSSGRPAGVRSWRPSDPVGGSGSPILSRLALWIGPVEKQASMAAELPVDIPDDVRDELELAIWCVKTYEVVVPVGAEYGRWHVGRSESENGLYQRPSQAQLSELLDAIYEVLRLRVNASPFDSRILWDVREAREQTVGDFKPYSFSPFAQLFDASIGACNDYPSAFEYVGHVMYALSRSLQACDIPAIIGPSAFGSLKRDEDDRVFGGELDEQRLESLAFLTGLTFALPELYSDKIIAELTREARAAAELRATRQGWKSKDTANAQGCWSEPDSPKRWAKVFNMHPDTLKSRIREGKIRAMKLSTKSYRIHTDDLPKTQPPL